MKTRQILLVVVLGVLTAAAQAQSYDKLWRQIDEADKANLPKTAVELADRIIAKATAEGNMGQMLKARVLMAERVARVTPDSVLAEIESLERWSSSAADAVDRAVLQSLLMGRYADYASSAGYRLRQLSAVAGGTPSADLREWTGSDFAARVRQLALASVACRDALLPVSSARYLPFVVQADGSNSYAHSMYHLLAERAIATLARVEHYSECGFYATTDSLYRELIAACATSPRYADGHLLSVLSHLQWQRSNDRSLSPSDADARYAAALDSLIVCSSERPVCAEVYHAKAQWLRSRGRNAEALSLCCDGLKRYSAYSRVGILSELRRSILAPYLSINADHTLYPGAPCELFVGYNNVSALSLSVEWGGRVVSGSKFALRPSANYEARDTVITITAPEVGACTITASADGAKAVSRQFSVSRLKLLTLRRADGLMEVVAVDAMTGRPLEGVTIKLMSARDGLLDSFTTDVEGRAVFARRDAYRYVRAELGADCSLPRYTLGGYYHYTATDNPVSEVRLLTDRSIYRPGQTVYVKGIAYSRQADHAEVKAGAAYTLRLLDANRREVARRELTTDDFGSFSTTFSLPATCLNGIFTLQTDGGSARIRVEEYKRPTFSIRFNPADGAYRTGDTISLTGVAQTLNGVPMDGLSLSYTVRRNLFRWMRSSSAGEAIASGSTTIEADGSFAIPVPLTPARPADRRNYAFTVEAVLTSVSGETQTAVSTLNAGRSLLMLSADMPDKICREDTATVSLRAVNMNGRPVSVPCRYVLSRIAGADTIAVETKTDMQPNVPFRPSEVWSHLPSGRYHLRLASADAQGSETSAESTFIFYSRSDVRPAAYTAEWFEEENLQFDADHPARFSYGTSLADVWVMMRMQTKDRLVESRLMCLTDTIVRFEIPYRDEYADGVSLQLAFVKQGRQYLRSVSLTRRLPDSHLRLSWSTFRDKLRPGAGERWSFTVADADGRPACAELLATMYDASLDKLWPNNQTLNIAFRLQAPRASWSAQGSGREYFHFSFPAISASYPSLSFDSFYQPSSVIGLRRYLGGTMLRSSAAGVMMLKSESAMTTAEAAPMAAEKQAMVADADGASIEEVATETENDAADAGADAAAADDLRTNLAETAFFYPSLRTDSLGRVVVEFTAPESLTEWRFNAYAHTQQMHTGMLSAVAQTRKELMLMPNMPRFLRSSDRATISAAVVNVSSRQQSGTATLTLFDPYTGRNVKILKSRFSTPAGETTQVSFEFTVPGGCELLGLRMVAAGSSFSDGEQQLVPVLPSAVHLTETVAFSVDGNGRRSISLGSLFNGQSTTATSRRLTVELTANPAWYAVQSLPSLSQPQADDAISLATACYANSVSAAIIKAHPQIVSTVEGWAAQPAAETTLSSMQRNSELKSVLLSESPWLLSARTEQEQRERISTLFNADNAAASLLDLQRKLRAMQLADGSWPWYKGMSGSMLVTAYVATLNARLPMLTGQPLTAEMQSMQQAAVGYLHAQMEQAYTRLTAEQRSHYTISQAALRYLYIVALTGGQVSTRYDKSYRFYLSHAADALHSADMGLMATAAVVLHRAGRTADAARLINSMREHLSADADGGLSFAFTDVPGSFATRQLPVHVDVMEAFHMVAADADVVERMKRWLLCRKRTQAWSSTAATADAVYALLMRGESLLSQSSEGKAMVGSHTLSTSDASATGALGYIEDTYTDSKTTTARQVSVEHSGRGMLWGAVYAGFSEELQAVGSQASGLRVERTLYVERTEGGVSQLVPLTRADARLAVGSRVVVRTTLSVPQRMEFVALRQSHAACMEPVSQLSGYRHTASASYYADVKDASVSLYFDVLGRGVYVFDTAYRISRSGRYQCGAATVQSVYAPEYAAHTASATIEVE